MIFFFFFCKRVGFFLNGTVLGSKVFLKKYSVLFLLAFTSDTQVVLIFPFDHFDMGW